jgi:amino acid transporter
VLGLAVQLAHGDTPVAFELAGMVALLTAYSYAQLSVAYPSRGGTVSFPDRAFGAEMFTGSLNVLLWLSYLVMLSLYAFAFGSYGSTFSPDAWQLAGKHALISPIMITIAGINLLNAELIGKAEIWIVAIKLAILLLFVGAGFLLIFAAVNTANARHAPHTHSRGWISAAGAVACLAALAALIWQTVMTGSAKLWVLAAMLALAVLIEGAYRLTKREINLHA